MFVAKELRKSNIVEYILYMFNIEDVIRAGKFDIRQLDPIIAEYKSDHVMVTQWYQQLIDQMQKEDVTQSGHLMQLREQMFLLNDLHIELLNKPEEEKYQELYKWCATYIKELKQKMHLEHLTEIEVCMDGLYGYMLLKLKKQEITEETALAMGTFSQLLRYLSVKYHQQIFIPKD